jgi:hypothetical protein
VVQLRLPPGKKGARRGQARHAIDPRLLEFWSDG